ncbi:MAG: hypothetical protein JSW47_10850 [Phycisphaerales bacterium]|nr:MAG: hypothetical protein JSW47_10850 [Phycisphaerales bacterium]
MGYRQPTRVGELPYEREPSLRVGRTTTTGLTRWIGTSCRIDTSGDNGGGLFGAHQGPGRHSSIDLVKEHWDLLVKGSSIEDPVPFDRSPTAEAFRKAVQNVLSITVEVLGDQRRRASRAYRLRAPRGRQALTKSRLD